MRASATAPRALRDRVQALRDLPAADTPGGAQLRPSALHARAAGDGAAGYILLVLKQPAVRDVRPAAASGARC